MHLVEVDPVGAQPAEAVLDGPGEPTPGVSTPVRIVVPHPDLHRRFATREALLDELTGWAARQFAEAVDAARPDAAPPLVALYQVTANVLRVKTDWSFAMNRTAEDGHTEAARLHAEVRATCARLFRRAQEAGVLRPDIDLDWTRHVYYCLIHEAAKEGVEGGDADALATRVVDTLLRGAGAPGGLRAVP
ncbi:TetR/AcrR family transcriptional regulator [Streptomyces sp. NPDC057748]|uniref:TetR/AcrR family transcriptional regulator n=1 Tax=unclassified Streptomyces TaxID=2593676 RepID=UPI00368B1963